MQDNKHLNGYIADPDDDIEYDTDGLWKPTKEGLGMKHCFDVLNELYSKNGKKFIEY